MVCRSLNLPKDYHGHYLYIWLFQLIVSLILKFVKLIESELYFQGKLCLKLQSNNGIEKNTYILCIEAQVCVQ